MLKCRRFRWQHLLPSSQIFGLKVGMQQAERKLSMQCRRGCVMEDTRYNRDINNVISIFHVLENDGSK